MKKLLILFYATFAFAAFGQSAKKISTISGTADFLNEGDTVDLFVYKYGIHTNMEQLRPILYAPVKNHQYQFSWPAGDYPQYIVLQFPKNPNKSLIYYFVEPGSKLQVSYQNGHLAISGQNSQSFTVQYQLRMAMYSYVAAHKSVLRFDAYEQSAARGDSILNRQLEILSRYRDSLNRDIFDFIKTQLYADQMSSPYNITDTYAGPVLNQLALQRIDRFRAYQASHPDQPLHSAKYLAYSPSYLDFCYMKYKYDSCSFHHQPFDLPRFLSYVTTSFSGPMRQQLIMTAIAKNKASGNYSIEVGAALRKVLPLLDNKDYISTVNSILANRIDGVKAYDFSLEDVNGRQRRLSEFREKVVVIDFWFTGCGNCKLVSPYLKAIEEKFKGKPVQFMSVSIDKNRETWKTNVSSGLYVSPEIVNLYTNGLGMNDQMIKKYQIMNFPTIIVISKTGQIVNVSHDPRIDNGANITKLITSCL